MERVDRMERLERRDNSWPDESQQLFQMLYSHFNDCHLVGLKYEEEDPHTWPSNWKRQAPVMILRPDTYIDNRPNFNSYQKQLVRRLSLKYQPLVRYYRQCIRNANNSLDNYSVDEDICERKTLRKLPNISKSWNKVKKLSIKK